MKVVVTGASGFVGKRLVPLLVSRGHSVVAASRSALSFPGADWYRAPELGAGADWSNALQGAEGVVHLAGRARIGPETKLEENLCQRINAEGTARLARQAADSGVRSFLFLSSVHAVAEESDEAITVSTVPRPVSAYGRSKLAAEEALRAELGSGACAWTIMRPPAVYGPANSGNMERLHKLVKTRIPLPFASVCNRRSFIYVENLSDLIVKCLDNPKAFGKIFLPSDGEDLSTPELIRAIARANAGVEHEARSWEHGGKSGDSVGDRETCHTVGRRGAPSALRSGSRHSARLFHFPPSLLEAAGRLPGLGSLRKLSGSLYVDSASLSRDLGWTAPFTMDEGLRRLVASS